MTEITCRWCGERPAMPGWPDCEACDAEWLENLSPDLKAEVLQARARRRIEPTTLAEAVQLEKLSPVDGDTVVLNLTENWLHHLGERIGDAIDVLRLIAEDLAGFYRARGINVHVLIKGKDLDIELEPTQVAMTAFSYFMENARSLNIQLDEGESRAIKRLMEDAPHAMNTAVQVAAALCPPPATENGPHYLQLADRLLKATDASGQPLFEPALASAIAKLAGARLDAMRRTE